MADFINTIDVLGDDAVFDSIINGTITELKDDAVAQVGGYTFFNCAALNSVSLPNCEVIGDFAFQNCSALATANFPAVTGIKNGAFNSCKELTTADFPKVAGASKGTNIFVGCTSLKSASFPLATEIPSANFDACTALETVSYPLATVVRSNAFRGCTALKALDFPAMAQISSEAFSGCSALKALVLRSQAVCSLDSVYAFRSTPIYNGTGYIYVPSALYDSYRENTRWTTLANQFRKLEEWTVDGTVTGELDTNRHMVRFFDEDGTLLSYVIVPTGGTAVYVGEDPVKEGYWAFTGWNPSPTNVTADMDCYAQFMSTDIYNWDSVFAAIDAGTYKNVYALGDTVPLDLGSEGLINMQIVAFDTDDLADGTGKAPITWISEELLATSCRMNPVIEGSVPYVEGKGAIGGWEKCEVRTYLKETVKPMIPELVRSAIKDITKTHTSFGITGYATSQTTTDDVWLPSSIEIGTPNGLYYEMFLNTDRLRVKKKVGSTSPTSWLLRDGGNSKATFFFVRAEGFLNSGTAETYHGVVLSFCT